MTDDLKLNKRNCKFLSRRLRYSLSYDVRPQITKGINMEKLDSGQQNICSSRPGTKGFGCGQ